MKSVWIRVHHGHKVARAPRKPVSPQKRARIGTRRAEKLQGKAERLLLKRAKNAIRKAMISR